MNETSSKIPNTIAFVLRDSENGLASSFQMTGEPVTDLIEWVEAEYLLLLKTEATKILFQMGNFSPPLALKKEPIARLRILNADTKSMNIEAPPIARQCNDKEKNVVVTREAGEAAEVT